MAARLATTMREEKIEHDAIAYIEDHYHDPYLMLEAYAKLIDCPERTIQRALRARGVTWRALVTEARMKAAYNLVTKTTIPIVDIATDVGYNYRHSFVSHYKRKYGQLPSETRREAHGVK